jgi:hypothetical protein
MLRDLRSALWVLAVIVPSAAVATLLTSHEPRPAPPTVRIAASAHERPSAAGGLGHEPLSIAIFRRR